MLYSSVNYCYYYCYFYLVPRQFPVNPVTVLQLVVKKSLSFAVMLIYVCFYFSCTLSTTN